MKMRKQPLFYGACTALVTPFLNNEINYSMLEQLLKRQMDSGIQSIVICGTTGEAPTLSDQEKITLFSRAKEIVQDHCLILAGTGSNCTEHAVGLSIAAERAGADGLLVVSPYYNKATADGLYRHYRTIAEAVHIPVILYNVPSRTGMDIPVSVYQRLAEIPNIAGVKEASSDITKILRIRADCPAHFAVWTGNDDHTVSAMALGAAGVISVVSNVAPSETQAMAMAAWDGDFDTASALQLQLRPLTELLFSEVNPVPVKAAMKCIGYDCGECRLPLGALSEDNMSKIENFFA
jgi:4-hydroxy-tetrahydrodipicolinate synthase